MSDTGHDSTAPGEADVRLTVWLSGQVQGVGMRWWVRARALELGLVGSASNRDDGRVEVVAEGPRAAAEALLALVSDHRATPAGPAGSTARSSGGTPRGVASPASASAEPAAPDCGYAL